MKTHTRLLALVCALIAAVQMISPAHAQQEKTAGQTLYDRLGGVYAIATVVDDFVDRIMVNETLKANPAVKEAQMRIPVPGLKYRVTALVCEATGGPPDYTGRTMTDSHPHLKISETEWQAMLLDFKATLEKFKVPEKEQSELLAIIESTKKDIVVQ